MRTLLLPLALLAAAPALAEPFPAETDAWHFEGRAKPIGGEARFARLDGTPDGKFGWRVTVVCGLVSLRTGREIISYRGAGSGGRSRSGFLGGTMEAAGYPTLGWSIEPTGDGILNQHIEFGTPGDTRCPNGVGDINTGD